MPNYWVHKNTKSSSLMDGFDAHVCGHDNNLLGSHCVLEGGPPRKNHMTFTQFLRKLSKEAIPLPFLCPHFNVGGGNLRALLFGPSRCVVEPSGFNSRTVYLTISLFLFLRGVT